jgi:oxygen-independent coproporphyrinogen-3 oxidase
VNQYSGVYSTVLSQHLYVHVPFCARRCAYCDFSIAVRRVVPVDDYLEGIRLELDTIFAAARAEQGGSNTIKTIYLGGGTPSRLGGEGIRDLIRLITERATFSDDIELTIEANPEDVTRAAVDVWLAAGINRVSLGAQSFDDRVLIWMHRSHDATQIRRAAELIRSGGIENLSLDLIFALPPEIERSWPDDLEAAIGLAPQHISLYGLTIEPATPLHRWTEQRRVSPTTDDRYAEEFLHAHERMTEVGFAHYEVSNFALPGRESRHNSAYWNGSPYLGVGPAAHSFNGTGRRWNVRPYAEWLGRLRAGQTVTEGEELLDFESVMSEKIYLGLRTQRGYSVGESDRGTAEQWARAGWAVVDGDLVRLSAEGWLRLDSLAAGLTGS